MEPLFYKVNYFRSHPPRCIAGFAATGAELPAVTFDGHASLSGLLSAVPGGMAIEAPEHINTVFALHCKCGCPRHFVHCYRWVNPAYSRKTVVTLSPLVLECAECRSMTDLLDTDTHGYDSELGHLSATVRAEGERTIYECPDCGRQPLESFVRFEYPGDLFGGDFREFAGREQDLFTWFSQIGNCDRCSKLLTVADFECA